MQDIGTDHILAPIRRLRAELNSLFTTRESVHTVNKCTNVHCPTNKIDPRLTDKQTRLGPHYPDYGKTALTRRKSSSLAAMQINKQSFRHKKIGTASPTQQFILSRPKSILHPTTSLSLHTSHPPSLPPPNCLPLHHQSLHRRHSDMTGVRRPDELWQRRARNSFLSSDTADDEHEEHNEVARTMWRTQMLRRRTVTSLSNHESRSLQEDMASLPSSNDSVEDHIYEEIVELDSDSDDTESETEDKSFLTLISSGRRNNLRYYGCTGWDFGTEVI